MLRIRSRESRRRIARVESAAARKSFIPRVTSAAIAAADSAAEAEHSAALALSIRQPWAELILRGAKRFDERSRHTRIRGRVLIYASLGRYRRDVEADIEAECGIELARLPRGVIVGSVELFACRRSPDGDAWQWWLRRPMRASELRKPDRQPMPVWFRPW